MIQDRQQEAMSFSITLDYRRKTCLFQEMVLESGITSLSFYSTYGYFG